MAWRYDLPKCPVSPADRGEYMKPSTPSASAGPQAEAVSPTLGSSIDLLIGIAFQNVETLDPNAKHKYYKECGCCGGTDQNRDHYKPDLNKVEHKADCPLARDLPILRAIGLASDASHAHPQPQQADDKC